MVDSVLKVECMLGITLITFRGQDEREKAPHSCEMCGLATFVCPKMPHILPFLYVIRSKESRSGKSGNCLWSLETIPW